MFRGTMNTETQTTERLTFDLWPEVGQMLGLSRPSTYAAAKRGEIPTLRIGGRILVPRAALKRLLTAADQPKGE
jgi:excisionase family DNA binding protein